MSDPMEEIRDSFFIECDELLEALQDGLQKIEDESGDADTINVVFRAVHSIKGGAGAFGLEQVVAFAHAFETALDEMRNGNLVPDIQALTLFFQCGDVLSDIVGAARDETEVPAAITDPLLEKLVMLAGVEAEEEIGADEFQPVSLSLDPGGFEDLGTADSTADLEAEPPGPTDYLIQFIPEPELYASGNEPLYLLRALAELGKCDVSCHIGDLPDLTALELPASFMSWSIAIETDLDEAALREVFDFVDGLCTLSVARPERPAGGLPDLRDPEDSGSVDDPPDLASHGVAPPPDRAPVPDIVPGTLTTNANTPDPDTAPAAKPLTAQTATALARPGDEVKARNKQNQTVRVDLDRIDRLVNLVGELVINQAMLAQSLAKAGVAGETMIATGLDEFQQLTRDIQDSVMMIRAQPVKSLFQRMARIVREASADVGKTVRLKTEGETTEIDKTVIERLADPLTHMIRNAVDHGLETTEKRVATGKPAEGNVTLRAAHKSGRVLIEVADDGGGIDRTRVKSIAEEKGLIAFDLDLSDAEIDNLLFLPGFSTASEISNLSGRGVGMDVVRNSISALGGRIAITSEAGKGTSFAISLPLTLAVLDGMVVTVGKETLVVPLSSISETLSLKCEDIRSLGPSTQVLQVRDTCVPLLDLGTELGYSPPRATYHGAIVLLIAQEDGSRAALVVDEIDDQRQVVIKGLSDSYGHVPGVAAATILGDGQIALILDPVGILSNATGVSRRTPEIPFGKAIELEVCNDRTA